MLIIDSSISLGYQLTRAFIYAEAVQSLPD